MRHIDITGQRFGMLEVLGQTDRKYGRIHWLVRCDCGNEKAVDGNALRSGNTKSCGCRGGVPTHRMHNTPEYKAWCGIVERCTNPSNKGWKHYGGRGITVCPEWLASFEAFYRDMGKRPPKHEIDRIDNEQGYSKSNCHWTTKKTNCRNRRSSVWTEYGGRTVTIAEAAELSGIPYKVLWARLKAGKPNPYKPLPTREV